MGRLAAVKSKRQFFWLKSQLKLKEAGKPSKVSGSIEDLRRTLRTVDVKALPYVLKAQGDEGGEAIE